jgi:hypothetical protein
MGFGECSAGPQFLRVELVGRHDAAKLPGFGSHQPRAQGAGRGRTREWEVVNNRITRGHPTHIYIYTREYRAVYNIYIHTHVYIYIYYIGIDIVCG